VSRFIIAGSVAGLALIAIAASIGGWFGLPMMTGALMVGALGVVAHPARPVDFCRFIFGIYRCPEYEPGELATIPRAHAPCLDHPYLDPWGWA